MTTLLDEERLDAHDELLDSKKREHKEKKKKKKRKSEGDGEDGGLKKDKKKKKKTKSNADAIDSSEQEKSTGDDGEASVIVKKKKKRPQKKSAAAYAASLEASAAISTATAEEQAAWLWSSCEETLRLSAAELAGLDDGGRSSSSSSVLLLPASSGSSDSNNNTSTLEERIAAADPKLAAELTRPRSDSGFSAPGTSSSSAKPLVVVVSPSANNALACIRSLPRTGANSHVAKLFARHIKAAEQEALLRQRAAEIRAAAGTPARIDALASNSSSNSPSSSTPPSLDLGSLRLLVLDVALDAKKRTLLDIPETRGDFWGLFKRHVMEKVKRGECRLALFDSGAKGRETTKEAMVASAARKGFGGSGRGGGGGFGGGGGRGFGGGGRGFGGGGRGGFGGGGRGRGRGRW